MHRKITFRAGLVATLLAALFLYAPIGAGAAPAPRQVNITPDSPPGWIPSEELERQARQTAQAFLGDLDQGRTAGAWALLSEHNQLSMPQPVFSQMLTAFNVKAGPVVERRITMLTWTKDPPGGPAPGVYAAFDLVSRFAKVDRHCGYLVLYQPPAGGPFRVARQQDVYMDNATASAITADGKQSVDDAWAQLSSACPNYRPPLTEAHTSTIGYPDVAAALAGLHAKPGVTFTTRDGWIIADDEADHAMWSFSPAGYAAYPAAVQRRFVREDGDLVIKMNVLCEASKQACDDLVRTFQGLNAQMKASLQGAH